MFVYVLTGILAYSFSASQAMGPLKVHPSNPRYFADRTGKAVYLTGSHTWSNLKDMGKTDPPPPFDFDAYLDFMQQHNHNFIRLWTWELTKYAYGQLTTHKCGGLLKLWLTSLSALSTTLVWLRYPGMLL